MPIESRPRHPLPADFKPRGGTPHEVKDGEDWNGVARQYGISVQDLIMFNFRTLNTDEVNWYLRRNVGCVLPSASGFNWKFSSAARPGVIYIPPATTAQPITINMQQFTHSIATLSWIDPRTGLPKVDNGDPGDLVTREIILANKGYRFANFLEASVTVADTVGPIKLVGHYGYTKDSGIYRAPSFLGTSSYAYPIKLSEPVFLDDGIEFRQIVGARTQAAEVIAGKLPVVGGPLAPMSGAIAQKLFPFPPIWSDLRLTIRYDGTYAAELVAYSLFPSLSYYENSPLPCFRSPLGSRPCQAFEKKFVYDGMPNFDRWFKAGLGWGPRRIGPNPCEGNPWGATKPDPGAVFGEPQPDPNEVVRRPTTDPPQPWLPGRE